MLGRGLPASRTAYLKLCAGARAPLLLTIRGPRLLVTSPTDHGYSHTMRRVDFGYPVCLLCDPPPTLTILRDERSCCTLSRTRAIVSLNGNVSTAAPCQSRSLSTLRAAPDKSAAPRLRQACRRPRPRYTADSIPGHTEMSWRDNQSEHRRCVHNDPDPAAQTRWWPRPR